MAGAFFEAVYLVVARIPKGKVATYGQIARLAGNPRAARTVGWALHAVPLELGLACHRVVNREGTMAPGFAFGGPQIQRERLARDGVAFLPDGRVDMARCLWSPGIGGGARVPE
ncbi:MAG: MGMT family protein [Oscillospiraceae bacterium]|nr:MGMT family protein [Oscillospiraceae bacterium]